MGMYNKVSKCCPFCFKTTTIQIPQIELGFVEFHLDFPNTMAELTYSQRAHLSSILEEKDFHCDTHGIIDCSIPLPQGE